MNAMQATRETIEARAAETAKVMIEARAKRYALAPSLLDNIEPGLFDLSPRELRFRVAALLGEEVSKPRRHQGLGGEVPLINLRAAAVYAERLIEIQSRKRRNSSG